MAGSPRGERRPRAVRRNEVNSDPPAEVGEVLRGLLGDGAFRRGVALGRLARAWGEVVGEGLAGSSVPAAIEGATLVVRVATPAWATQVRFLAPEVLKRANAHLGSDRVAEVRVQVGPITEKPLRPNG